MIVTKYSNTYYDCRSIQIDTNTNKFNMSVWNSPSMWEPLDSYEDHLNREYIFYSKIECLKYAIDGLATERNRLQVLEDSLQRELAKEIQRENEHV